MVYLRKNVEQRRGKWPKIAAEAGVSYSWLVQVMNGKTPNPQVKQVQKVVDVLRKVERGELLL